MDKLRFQCFGTGSSGNSYYIGNGMYGILIDAGLGSRTIRKHLKNIGLDFSNIRAIFITHDHVDHIRGVGGLGERFLIPIYSTPAVHEGIRRGYCVTEKLERSQRFIEKNQTIEIGDIKVTAFPVSHDASDSVGYTVEYQQKRFTFATDLGFVGEEATEHLCQADYAVLEANYDEEMLINGPYPALLKKRIMANTGHLSNEQAATFLANNYNGKLKNVFLCHMSKENNFPELAYNTVKARLEEKSIIVGQDIELVALERLTPSELFFL